MARDGGRRRGRRRGRRGRGRARARRRDAAPTRRLTPTTTRDAIGSNGDKETVRGVQDRATAREAVRGVHEVAETQAKARRAHGGAGARRRRHRDDVRGERGRSVGDDVLRKRARGGWIRRARIGVDGELSTTRGDAVALAENRAVLDFATTGARRVTTTNSTRHTDITCDERTARAILRTARALTP